MSTAIDVFDADGILVGWECTIRNAEGKSIQTIVPRCERHVAEDRVAIAALLKRAGARS